MRLIGLLIAFGLTSAVPGVAIAGAGGVGIADDVAAGPSKTVRLLTVGNSFSGNATRFLGDLARSAGHVLVHHQASMGGATLAQHWERAERHEKDPRDPLGLYNTKRSLEQELRAEPWDFVTIQQASVRSHDLSTYRPYARQLFDYIRRHAPRAEVLVHQTWAYRRDDPRFAVEAPRPGEPASQEAMYRGLAAAYTAIATELGARMIPVGDAFHRADNDAAWGYRPDATFDFKTASRPALPGQAHSLHVGWQWTRQADGRYALRMDGHHASVAGQYLGACVFYEVLFGETVVDNRFVPEGLDAGAARFLRETAHQAVARTRAAEAEAERNARAPMPMPRPRPGDGDGAYDLVVIGGTPGGIATAVTAARLGRSVALVESHRHLGGMSASGLGKSDIEHRPMIQGLFREFVDRVRADYVERYGAGSENVRLCRDGYYYEPSVAESVFNAMVAEQPGITVILNHAFLGAETQGNRIVAVRVQDRAGGRARTVRGRVFADATYEGDVYEAAGAGFRVGRESRDEFREPHAGHIVMDWRKKQVLGGTGRGDGRLQAYTYRLCLSSDPANQAPLTAPPPGYDRGRYLGYVDDLTSGRFGSANLTRIALSIAELPNAKTDVNMNPRGLGFVFAGENRGYLEMSGSERERVCETIRNLTLGLLWFLQNDQEIPAAARELARRYHPSRDEFTDNGNFPFQLYVREGRRLIGEFTLSERNITEQPGLPSERTHADAIAVGEFPIDSFPVQERQPGDTLVLEGYLSMLGTITRPYQIPYRILVPRTLNGLLVPVAASTTHVAYSSIRLEPTWMALGQAAGVAAHLALEHDVEVRAVPIAEMQGLLRRQHAVLDLATPTPAREAIPR
jgi:hypothetical protein